MRRPLYSVDENQAGIVKALRSIGCSVVVLSAVGKGCPDLLVGRLGVTYLLEVKRPQVVAEDGTLKKAGKVRADTAEAQANFAATWRGGVVRMVTDIPSTLAAVGVFR